VSAGEEGPFIGRVIISEDRQARPTEFWITIDRPGVDVEVGSIVAVEGEGTVMIGVVDDIRYASRSSSVAQFYQGQVEVEGSVQPSLRTPIERYAHVRVLAASPPRKIPPSGLWPVRYVVREDVDVLFGKIPSRCRVLAGFLKGRREEPIPVYFHSDFLLGREGAHINITGKTGLATKTSYAVFLAYSVLSWARREGQRVAVVMFNVKRGDLMRLHKLPEGLGETEELVRAWARRSGMEEHADRVIRLWKEAFEQEGIDPFSVEVRYFTYPNDPYLDEEHDDTWFFSYGLADLSVGEVIASIYRPGERITDPQYAMIHTYFDSIWAAGREIPFMDMRNHFYIYSHYKPERVPREYLSKVGPPILRAGAPM